MSDFFSDITPYQLDNYGYVRLPKIDITPQLKAELGLKETDGNLQVLRGLALKGWKEKSKKIPKEKFKFYGERMKYELSMLDELGFVDYILLVWMVINKARELGVFIDFGRGSCSGAATCWLLGISGVDPVEKNLIFERFVSRARAGKKIIDGATYLKGDLLADIDVNLGDGRDKIVEWLKEIYPNRVSKICNISTFTTKILLKDVYKSLEEVNEDEAKSVSDMVEVKFGIAQEIQEAYDENPKFKHWADQHKEVVEIAKSLSGLMRQSSTHASGYLVSYFELTDLIPLELSKDGDLVSGYDMREVSNFATKLDLLGLTTNKILKNIIAVIDEDINGINLDDNPLVYNQFQTGDLLPYGLYQISADCAYGVLNAIKPKNIYELSDVSAIARPGSLAWLKDYKDNTAKSPHSLFDKILKPTRNLALYQEQLMQMCVAIGFTLEESELIRKIVGKKEVTKVKEWKEKIYNKAEANGFERSIGDLLWKILEDSAKYSFNLSHSVATSYLSALTVYLKYKYPLQFYWACLVATKDLSNPIEEITLIQKELEFFKIKLLPPDITKGNEDFEIVGNDIRFGIGNLKGVSEKAIEKLRNFNCINANKFQLFEAAKQAELSTPIMTALIMSGCLPTTEGETRSKLVLEYEIFSMLTDREKPLILNLGERYKFDLTKIILDCVNVLKNEKGKPLIKESRLETLKAKYAPCKEKYLRNCQSESLCSYVFENEFLGFSYSITLKEIFSKKCADLSEIREILADKSDVSTKVRVAAQVDSIEKRVSREKKTPYLSLMLRDNTGCLKSMIFGIDKMAAITEHNGKEIEEGDIIILNGMKKGDVIFGDSLVIQENPIILKKSQLSKEKEELEEATL